MLTRTMSFIALAGSLGCLRAAEPAAPIERAVSAETTETSRDDRVAALERELGEARRELALRHASLEQASVRQATLDRRIEELTELNDEIIARLRTAAESAQLAAHNACLTPVQDSSADGEPPSVVALSEAPTEHESLVDEGMDLSSPSRTPGDELAVNLETD